MRSPIRYSPDSGEIDCSSGLRMQGRVSDSASGNNESFVAELVRVSPPAEKFLPSKV